MRYHHTFRNIHISHFNGRAEYDALEKAHEEAMHIGTPDAVFNLMMQALSGTHGHNLRIDVRIDSEFTGPEGYLIDDRAMAERVIDELRDRNLSVHPYFVARRERATTENICSYVHHRIATEFRDALPHGARISVRVCETEDIFAEQTWTVIKRKEGEA